MIRTLQRRLATNRENGFTLVEVVVAMAIFMLISLGLLHTMNSVLVVTRDSKARHVAGNLAAQEIDLVRDAVDLFALNDDSRTVTVNGDTFAVTRSTAWVTADDELQACGAGGGTLRFKHVKVTVSWSSGGSTKQVESDTLINPSTRINDPELGTILVVVKSAISGEGVSGIPVRAVPTSGATLTATTDSAGCAYFLKAAPSTYTVNLSSPTGTTYVDPSSSSTPVQTAGVVRGEAASVPFFYDRAGALRIMYGGGAATGILPNNLPTTLMSTRDPSALVGTSSANPRNVTVAPWPDGYSPIAGNAVTCEASDPARWAATATLAEGTRIAPVAAESGSTSDTVNVPMGAVRVTNVGSARYVVAVSTIPRLEGEPGCVTSQVLRFDQVASNSSPTILLPYGSWTIHTGSSTSYSATASNQVAASRLTLVSPGTLTGAVVTLDPRTAP